MKNILKLTLAAALMFVCSTSFAQKMGFINLPEVIMAMPERDTVVSKLERLTIDFRSQLEAIQVEFNNKSQDFVKNASTMNDAVKQMKEKELHDIQVRFEESQQALSESYQRSQEELMEPVVKKATEALAKVSKSQNIIAVFNLASGSLAYHDTSAMTDMTPLVKKELGIQ